MRARLGGLGGGGRRKGKQRFLPVLSREVSEDEVLRMSPREEDGLAVPSCSPTREFRLDVALASPREEEGAVAFRDVAAAAAGDSEAAAREQQSQKAVAEDEVEL